jgi:hypothetical protein
MNESDKRQLEVARNMEPDNCNIAAVGGARRFLQAVRPPDAPWGLFAQNSTSCSACQHEQILLANEEEPTLCCRSCCKGPRINNSVDWCAP